MPSDSSYAAVSRHARPPTTHTAGGGCGGGGGVRPVAALVVDETWASETLSDDEVEIARHEAAVAPLLEEGELDADAIVVSPTGNSASAANTGEFAFGFGFVWFHFVWSCVVLDRIGSDRTVGDLTTTDDKRSDDCFIF